MSCKEIKAALVEDSSLRAEEKIATHLNECCECKSFCNDLLDLEELVRDLSTQWQISPEMESETIARLSGIKPRRFSPLRLGLVFCLLVAVSVGTLSSWVERERKESGYEVPDTFLLQDSLPASDEDRDGRYFEVVVEGSVEGEVILRLPSVIEIRQTEPNEEFYVQNVSH